ncbi:MAG: hypothetical protein FWE67_15260, partial [Planctomycetaceae bacterium]|nr:hypothetical protein [Planctomycetaceae bacterium]
MKSVLSVLSKYPVFASALVLGLSSGLAGFALAESETPVNPKPDTPKTEIQAKVQKEAPPVSIFDKLVAEYEEKQNAPPVKKQETPVKKSGGSIIDRAQAELAEETSRTGKKDTGAAAVKDSPSKDSAKDTEKSPVKIADNSAEKAAEKKIDSLIPVDSFWSVVKPNEAPVEKIAEKQSSENKPETKSEQTAAPAVPKETEQKEVVQEVPVNASVWDAVPTSISLDGTTFAGAKSDIKSDVKTAEETITEPVKIAVRIEAVNSAQKESVADSEKPAEKPAEEEAKDTAEKPAEEMAKDETVAETEEAVKEPAEESAKEMAKEETAIETKESVKGPVAEEAAEVAKEESKPAEQKSGEAKEDETKEKAKKDAKDRVKTESEKSETASVEEKKETAPKKSDAGKSDTEKSEKEVSKDDSKTEKDKAESKTNDKKSHAFSGSIPKTADMLKDLTDKNLAEKQELDGIAETSVNKEPQRLPELTNPDFDDDIDDTTVRHSLIDGSKVGDPHAKDKIKLMYDEIINGLKSRNMHGKYEMWKNYARSTLRSTTGLNTGSEVDGRCRLSWYTQLYSEPIFSVFAAEEFSRQLHHGLSGNHRQLAEVMSMIRKKLDVPGRNDTGIRFPKCETPFDAINEVKRCLLEAQMAHARAMSTISANDQKTLATDLYSTFSGPGVVNGHTIPNRTYGRKLVNILETMDKSAMHAAADALMPLTNKALLALLDELPEDAFPTVHINGQQVQRIVTSAGDIIIGGRGNNVYDLDSPDMKNVVCVIDLGGNDLYRDGTCNLDRPILVIIDLHGNDIYTGTKPGIQGGSILGVSLLIDCEGNDTYTAGDVAQGSSIGGIGILLDYAGDDSYKALKRAQGHALCGVGVLCDYAGNDKYRASLWAQGFGAPGGFGVLNDVSGKDHYFCGGIYYDSYPEHPGYDG